MSKHIFELIDINPSFNDPQPILGKYLQQFCNERNKAIDECIVKYVLSKHEIKLTTEVETNIEKLFIDGKEVLSIDKSKIDIIEIEGT